SSAEMFRLCYERLDATCLGVLEADGEGNVNVSRRSGGPRDYIGPGGFIDLSTAARTVVFVAGWMMGGEMAVDGTRVRLVRHGRAALLEQVGHGGADLARITPGEPRAIERHGGPLVPLSELVRRAAILAVAAGAVASVELESWREDTHERDEQPRVGLRRRG